MLERFIAIDPECVNLRRQDGLTPIDLAAWAYAATTSILATHGANPVNFDDNGFSTIARPIWRNDFEIFKLLLPYYRTADSLKSPGGMNLLHVAAQRGAVRIAEFLIGTFPIEDLNPAGLDNDKRTPLHYAAMHDQLEAFKFFLKHCNVMQKDRGGWNALHLAASNGALKIVEEAIARPEFEDLLEAEDDMGQTALMIAAQQHQYKIVALLAQQVGVNRQVSREGEKKGWTALHFSVAVVFGDSRESWISRNQTCRTVRTLLDVSEIDLAMKAGDGKEAILLNTFPQVRRLVLFDQKFQKTRRLSDGSTPLNLMIKHKDRVAVEKLLYSRDVDVEFLGENGEYAPDLLIQNGMEIWL